MIDIQLIRLLDTLQVNSIRNAAGITPRSIIVKGDDFHDVETVLINGLSSPEFMVYSTTELIAVVPTDIAGDIITEVSVLSASLTLTSRSLVEFTFGTRPRTLSGTTRLIQTFLRILMRTPGSNIFHKTSGGGLVKRVGGNVSPSAAADVAVAVSAAKSYIIRVQSGDRNIPPSERLLSAEIGSLSADPRSTTIAATIILTSQSGKTGAATILT